jgi:lipopolysaccharide/colanic/teichoic acid biosynthesis glycosyltransferase
MKLEKRLFDVVASAIGLLVLWPVFLVIAALIKLEDGGPVFYRQERIGYKGRPFKIWKFRTMVVNADKLGKPLTVGRDPRITRVGYWLRKFKLDELPQLLNVLLGEMSLVGPRPEVPQYVALYTPEQRRVLDLVPGITDPASIKFANEAELLAEANDPEKFYIEHIMPTKIRLNMEYASHATLWSDILVILKTLVRIVR